jgi:riboflavin biosynthesis pyrimidine reductase
MHQLRSKLRRGRERNILVTARADFQMSDYAVFDGEHVDVTLVTTPEGAKRLDSQREQHPEVDIVEAVATDSGQVDLRHAVTALKERYGISYLLCEGGPKLYSGMLMAGLIDEKFVTVSPMEVGSLGPHGPRPTVLPDVGFSKDEAVRWSWLSCRKVGDYQFHRFRRNSPAFVRL